MNSGNGPPRQYSISMSKVQRAKLKQLHQEQDALGLGQQFLSAYRTIVRRLQTDPKVFGEALYRLPALQLELHQAIVAKIVVDYAVHEHLKFVFIQGFKVLS